MTEQTTLYKPRFRSVRQDNGLWSVASPGGAVVLRDESMVVADNVCGAANGQPSGVGECDEIGENLRRQFDRY